MGAGSTPADCHLSHLPIVERVEQRLCLRFFIEDIMYHCAFCERPGNIDKYFVCPSHIWRPNMYSVCENHQTMSLQWHDVYPAENCQPITRHEDKVNSFLPFGKEVQD